MKYTGAIDVIFDWSSYPSQKSSGLLSGLSNDRDKVVDFDASAIFLDAEGHLIDSAEHSFVSSRNPQLFDHAVSHGGDNISADTNSEAIHIDFEKLPDKIAEIRFVLDRFKDKANTGFRTNGSRLHSQLLKILDSDTKEEKESIYFNGFIPGNAVFCGRFIRKNNEWHFEKVDKTFYNVHSYSDILAQM